MGRVGGRKGEKVIKTAPKEKNSFRWRSIFIFVLFFLVVSDTYM